MGKRRRKIETETAAEAAPVVIMKERISLGALLSEEPVTQAFHFWIIGTTPLITHAWSMKAKLEILRKQTKAGRRGKEERNPEQDFIDSLYDMGDGKSFGFPATAIKKATWSGAHKDRGVAKTDVQAALWLDAEIIRVRPAHAGAICDMPLIRIWGSKPEMREDMVRVGAGVQKTANLAYRAQFTTWAMRVTGTIDPARVPTHQLAALIRQAGEAYGLGDWRNEKNGYFGAFRMANAKEEEAWNKFAAGKGPLPKTASRALPPIAEAAE